MQIDHDQEQCHHRGCTCVVPNGQDFCSEYCRIAEQAALDHGENHKACACGHAPCHGDLQPHGDNV